MWLLLSCSCALPDPVVETPPPAPVATIEVVLPERVHVDQLDELPMIGLSQVVPDLDVLKRAWARDVQTAVDRVDRDLVVELADAKNWPAGNVGRAFDVRWLASPAADFQLVGVVNRLDRRDVTGGCGELRLLYRLYYDVDGASSRLPFTVNVVKTMPPDDCRTTALEWVDGPPDEAWIRALPTERVEVNIQAVRFPSGVETEFAGQAMYVLRVYELDGTPRALENTPETVDSSALIQWISQSPDAIANGTHLLPTELSATEALSWSTLGVNRLANKPFDAALDVSPLVSAETIERLNGGTCMGCHQGQSTAGFHFLGHDDPDVSGITNRLAVPFSPHYAMERERRRTYVAAVASGQEPDTLRIHPMTVEGPVGVNRPCLDGDLGYPADWSCEEGLTCTVVAADPNASIQFGQCLPPEPTTAGQTCRSGTIASDTYGEPFNARSYRDTLAASQIWDLPQDKSFTTDSLNCRPTVIGVPLGRTYRSCTTEERTLESVTADSTELCAVVGGSRFDKCVEEDFHSCLAGIVARGVIDLCHADQPCREDYICQALPYQLDSVPTEAGQALADQGIGFCTPTYFLFQLRLDGHPVPPSSE
ncbi:MAG: hypothetical protein GY913_10320 [Proteobacteria bacterium]|nr:hypothetical protein [Pseudomonadota bacterium]MCP4917307.1 hypothetical protein [Pseudomonadota bacterium]